MNLLSIAKALTAWRVDTQGDGPRDIAICDVFTFSVRSVLIYFGTCA